jgi:hypothetical protein
MLVMMAPALTKSIDSQAPALLIVEPERCHSALYRRRLTHRLNKTKQLHLLAADQMGGPPLQVGILRRLRLRLAAAFSSRELRAAGALR